MMRKHGDKFAASAIDPFRLLAAAVGVRASTRNLLAILQKREETRQVASLVTVKARSCAESETSPISCHIRSRRWLLEPMTSGEPMHLQEISRRYVLLQAEIKKQMSSSQKWRQLPASLDRLNTLRQQYLAAKRSFDLLTEEGEKLAHHRPVH